MKNKGFTLAELLAVIVIMSVILMVAVPVFNGVVSRMHESAYETKIRKVLATAEKYSAETGVNIFDVKTLILNGKLEADNELGEYKDPRTDRDMKCDILNVVIDNGQYYAKVTESDTCYDLEELENLYGLAEIKVYRDNEVVEEKDGWVSGKNIEVRYQLKDDYQAYQDYIEKIVWSGEGSKTCTKENILECKSYAIQTEEIKTLMVTLELFIKKDGIDVQSTIKKTIRIDNQAPYVLDGSIIQNDEIETSSDRKVEFDLSDGNGVGVSAYAIISGDSCSSNEYETNRKVIQQNHVVEYLTNGEYQICVEDKLGNRSDDNNGNHRFTVSNVDASKPQIMGFTITSKESYPSLDTRLSIQAKDDGGVSNLKMCISNTGYLKDCSWEAYTEGKDWKLAGNLDGLKRTVYLSIQDSAGNIAERVAEYTPYQECTNTRDVNYSEWGTCSKECDGGIQERTYELKDNHTGKVCTIKKESQPCNTHSCDPVASMDPNDYESSKKVLCDRDLFQRLLDEYFPKFQTGLNIQNFRNALYDCGSTTGSVLSGSDKAYAELRNHSRTRVVSGNGRSDSCTCYDNKNDDEHPSSKKQCEKPACNYEHEFFVSGNLYNGRILVLSATTKQRPLNQSSLCDGDGDWENANSSGTSEKYGYHNILILDSANRGGEACGWGYYNQSDNGITNYEEAPLNSRGERSNRIAWFQNGLHVGLFAWQNWYYESYMNDRTIYGYSASTVYVQIFVI